jgi:hypothetical protein
MQEGQEKCGQEYYQSLRILAPGYFGAGGQP